MDKDEKKYACPDSIVTATLHFWSWDIEKYGVWKEPPDNEQESGYQRSPMSRFSSARGIDKTASGMIKRLTFVCPYCRKIFDERDSLSEHEKNHLAWAVDI